MIYKMLTSAPGAADANGATTRVYAAGETLVADAPWKETVIRAFVDAGLAEEAQTTGPTETKAESAAEEATAAKTTPKRRTATARRKKSEG
jgi:hypothetical protein